MTPDDTKAAIAIMLAATNGATIESRPAPRCAVPEAMRTWGKVPDLTWNWYSNEYRIAPQPREWFLVVDGSGHVEEAYRAEATARDAARSRGPSVCCVRVREVLEDDHD